MRAKVGGEEERGYINCYFVQVLIYYTKLNGFFKNPLTRRGSKRKGKKVKKALCKPLKYGYCLCLDVLIINYSCCHLMFM